MLLSFRIVYHHNRIVTRWGRSNIDSVPKYLGYRELSVMEKVSLYKSQFGGKREVEKQDHSVCSWS